MKLPVFLAGLTVIAAVTILAALAADPMGPTSPLVMFSWISVWWLSLAALSAAARRSGYGKVFWFLPSTWLALSPVLQFYLPLISYYFGWHTISDLAVLTRMDEALGLWTLSTIMIAVGCAFVEPRALLLRGLVELPRWIANRREHLKMFGRAAAILLIAGIAARLVVGGFSAAELQTTLRVSGETTIENSRITMLVVPFLTLGTCLYALRYAMLRRVGLPTQRAFIAFGFAVLVTGAYNIILGSRGGVLYAVAPCILIILLISSARAQRPRLVSILIFALTGAILLQASDVVRGLTSLVSLQIARGSISFGDLLHSYIDLLINPTVVEQGNALENFTARMGTGWVLTRLLDSPGAFGDLHFWSFLRVYSVSFPTSISPWDAFIPYPTQEQIPDLGYIAAQTMLGFPGAGIAVPPQAEMFWRFGVWGMPVASLVWGISLGVVFRLWTRLSPVLGLFVCCYFALPLMLAETGWQVFASIVRQPLMLLAALHFAQYWSVFVVRHRVTLSPAHVPLRTRTPRRNLRMDRL